MPYREIVSFRSCVRCEAVCERETDEIPVARVATRFTMPRRGVTRDFVVFWFKIAPLLNEIVIFG